MTPKKSITFIFIAIIAVLWVYIFSYKETRITVIMEIPFKTDLELLNIEAKIKKILQQNRNIVGLEHIYMTKTAESIGGIYLWSNRKRADNFFDLSWQKKVEEMLGKKAKLTFIDTPVIMPTDSINQSIKNHVISQVKVPAPWYAPKKLIANRMRNSLPEYRKVDGLVQKYYTISDDRSIGGIYLWRDQVAAEKFYDKHWQKKIVDSYGESASIKYFDTDGVFTSQ